MRYGDLVQFDPIESVVQLRDTDRAEAAHHLVSTYVISQEMAERLTALVIPNLQFDRPTDNKGLLIVGNYGTGKSHLMSVVSAVAERGELAGALTHAGVAEAARAIAGRFRVVRSELGSTTMDLREFVCSTLAGALAEMGIAYRFPPRHRLPNHKGAFEELMAAFHQRYPEQGLLLVVDELLDYLRSRRDAELILDLNFLREIGEIGRHLRFRFLAGLQEMLFDNPRFQFVAGTLLRVRDRFEQVRIARQDVQYVVAERLLRKTPDQRARIRQHLLPFTRFYGDMSGRLEEYVRLFPVHPDYLAVFESIAAVEKREVLRTLSRAMQGLLEEPVPAEEPGLIAYDSYWRTLRDNPSYRAVPEIREVIEVSQALEARVERASRPAYRPLALRIVHGLSVHRLTVGDLYAPVGATPEELRDGLCLYDPLVAALGGDPADDLLSQVEMVLREIHRTVSGQFLSHNVDSRQWYLDLRKREDFDALIEKRAESLDAEQTGRAYFDALRQVILEHPDQPAQVSGFRLWEHELLWPERGTTRRGHLCFGAPEERSTAAAPRDFHLYFLRPDEPLTPRGRREPDEVFFRLTGADAELRALLLRRAAALDLAATAAGQRKRVYQQKADEALHQLTGWLRRNLATAFEVACQGKARPLLEWVQDAPARQRMGLAPSERAGARDLANLVASLCLAPHWEDQAPQYPRFTGITVTEQNRARLAQEALRWIAGPARSREGAAVLEALELLEGERLNPGRSRYAGYLVERVAAKGQGQVLNRDEVLQPVDRAEYLAPERFRLEPELTVVLLGALVYSGDLVLAAAGRKFDASALEQLAATPIAELIRFRHLEAPREWNVPGLKALFELVGLEPGLAHQVASGKDEPVGRLLPAVGGLVERMARTEQQLQGGLPLWGRPLLSEAAAAERRARLEEARRFLESLQAFTSPGRLKDFREDPARVRAYQAALAALRELEALRDFTAELRPLADYLAHAETLLPEEHPWRARMYQERAELLARITTPAQRDEPGFPRRMAQSLGELKREYIRAYTALHTRARLGVGEDRRKQALLRDVRLEQLRRLAAIDLMHRQQLLDYQERLTELESCFALTERELEATPLCPHCHFRPAVEAVDTPVERRLDALEAELEGLHASWTAALREALRHPSAQESLTLLPADSRSGIEEFLRLGELPVPLDDDLVAAVRQVLSGLERVVLRAGELRAALLAGGLPATPEELRRRFERLLARLTRGKPGDRVRVVVE